MNFIADLKFIMRGKHEIVDEQQWMKMREHHVQLWKLVKLIFIHILLLINIIITTNVYVYSRDYSF